MKAKLFLDILQENLGIDFYAGVPDSQLAALCNLLYEKYHLGENHIVTANEGAAVGLAAGHYIATGKPALIYLQNSGIGNIVNPVTSLLNENVYGIPCVFVVGWRGEPGVKDEPQHSFMGQITIELLNLMKMKCFVVSKDTEAEEYMEFVQQSQSIIGEGKSVAFVIRKGALDADNEPDYVNSNQMKREEALHTILIEAGEGDIFVSTTGKTSRELYELRESMNQGHERDFLTVGSMGHASMIAMGISMDIRNRTVWCIDGDGAALMHLGSMAVLAKTMLGKLIHIVFNNGAHESVGGMPVAYGKTNFCELAESVGYVTCMRVSDQNSLEEALRIAASKEGTCFIEVMVALWSRSDLGRPKTTPKDNKNALMHFLKGVE